MNTTPTRKGQTIMQEIKLTMSTTQALKLKELTGGLKTSVGFKKTAKELAPLGFVRVEKTGDNTVKIHGTDRYVAFVMSLEANLQFPNDYGSDHVLVGVVALSRVLSIVSEAKAKKTPDAPVILTLTETGYDNVQRLEARRVNTRGVVLDVEVTGSHWRGYGGLDPRVFSMAPDDGLKYPPRLPFPKSDDEWRGTFGMDGVVISGPNLETLGQWVGDDSPHLVQGFKPSGNAGMYVYRIEYDETSKYGVDMLVMPVKQNRK